MGPNNNKAALVQGMAWHLLTNADPVHRGTRRDALTNTYVDVTNPFV